MSQGGGGRGLCGGGGLPAVVLSKRRPLLVASSARSPVSGYALCATRWRRCVCVCARTRVLLVHATRCGCVWHTSRWVTPAT